MLAKLWKKVLLAICIIACIFNIMSKLVNRHSLKENLQSANDGVTVFDIFKKDDVQVSESESIIDGVLTQEPVEKNVVSNKTTTDSSETVIVENSEENTTVVEENANTEDASKSTAEENAETTTEEKDKTFKFSDFTIIF